MRRTEIVNHLIKLAVSELTKIYPKLDGYKVTSSYGSIYIDKVRKEGSVRLIHIINIRG